MDEQNSYMVITFNTLIWSEHNDKKPETKICRNATLKANKMPKFF